MTPRHFTFHYTLKDHQGRVLDTSRGGEPVSCVEGGGQIVEGLEAALATMTAGEQRAVVVPPERGYGLYEEEMVQPVWRAHLPVGELKVGDRFQTEPDRHAPVVTVRAIEGDRVVLDANHPLAGQELFFDVELVAVHPATAAERPGAA